MVVFANAGTDWPEDQQRRLLEAGTHALSGGAEFWRLLSEIEGWEEDRRPAIGEEERLKTRCVKALQQAADIYSKNLEAIPTAEVDLLTPAELDMIAPPYGYDRGYDYPYPLRDFGSDVRQLYRELILRIGNLTSQVKALDLSNDRRDLAFSVFRAMREWELISFLARFIAVLNRRRGS